MSASLQINSQKWQLLDSEGMKLFLPRQRLDSAIYFQADWSFFRPEADAVAVPADVPKLRLRLVGFVPGLRDWRDLENLFLGYGEPIDGRELPDARGPDMWLWQPGEAKPVRFGSWETDLKFGERHGYEFDFTLDAFCRSERASKFKVDQHTKEFFNQPVPPDWEVPEWANEVDEELSLEGRVKFTELFCSVPINSAQPLEWAAQMARRELAVEQFGPGTISDPDHSDGNYKPNDGISETGRLVVLPMPAG
jgi:hypothetical protein